MRRGWRPVLVGFAIVVVTFALAQRPLFEPSAPAGATAGGDVYRGQVIFERECAGCHGDAGVGGAGPRLAGAGLTAEEIAAAIEQGAGIMPAGLVEGAEESDVVAYAVSIATP